MSEEIFNFRNGANTIRLGVFGSSGRGKTRLITDALKNERLLKGKFDRIILINPEIDAEPIGENWNSIKLDRIYNVFSMELIEQLTLETKAMFLKDRNHKTLLICDDCVSENTFSNKHRSAITKSFTNSRKFGMSQIIISQKMTLLPTTLHSQFNFVIIFNTGFAKERKSIEDSYKFKNTKLWNKMWKFTFKDFRDTMLIDVDNEIYYRNFNKLILEGADEDGK